MSAIDYHFRIEPWVRDAVCATVPDADSIFFPGQGATDLVRQAKAICATCPVAEQCLDYALRTVQRHGVWGGQSEKQRRNMRRSLGLTPVNGGNGARCGTESGYNRHRSNGEPACQSCLDAKARAKAGRRARLGVT